MAAIELKDLAIVNDADLVEYWRFEQSPNGYKNGKNLTPINTPAYDLSYGQFGYGFLATPSKYFTSTDAVFTIDKNLTFGCWIKGTTGGYTTIMGISQSGGKDRKLFNWNTGVLAFSIDGQNNVSSTSIIDGNRHFVACTLDGSYVSRLYVDGNLVGSPMTMTSATQQTSGTLYIGNDSYNEQYTGNIDEAFIYKRVWTADEISGYYAGTLPGLNAAPNTPTISAPTNGATGQIRNPVLSASAFSDPDAGNTHAGSQWEIYTDAGFTTKVWDSGDSATNLTSVTVNTTNGTFSGAQNGRTTLASNTTYYWRVKYKDNNGAWSAYGS